jgi:thioesterase domain-containing protein
MNGTVVESEGEAGLNRGKGNARIVQLKPGRPGPCLFLLPGTGGRIEGFADLASSLQIPMPVFALEARGVDGSSTPDTSVEETAQHYLTRVQPVQAAGPYFLAGHSFGGLVVLEMAQRLIEAKERVACLIMLDTPIAKKYWTRSFYFRTLKVRLHGHLKRILTNSVRENLKYYFRRLLYRGTDLNKLPPDVMIGSNSARVLLANGIACEKYYPKFYPDKLTFFRSCDGNDFELLWRDRVRELEIHFAVGDHVNLIQPPHVTSLAADISACLMKALEATTPAPSSPLDS